MPLLSLPPPHPVLLYVLACLHCPTPPLQTYGDNLELPAMHHEMLYVRVPPKAYNIHVSCGRGWSDTSAARGGKCLFSTLL